jgi:exosortase
MSLEVAEACSGIRSLMSLLTLSIFYGYFLERSMWQRVALAFASVPIAIAANALRLLGTGLCVQYWDPEKAQGFFHEFQGWVMFLVSLVCLVAVDRIFCLFPLKRRQA